MVTPPDSATELEVLARQWNWSYRLPGEDGQLGAVAVSHTSEDNPLGIDPSDPFGQDDIIVYDPVLHLKVGEPVTFLLRSTDVLHNFTVPQFRVKMDFVPGQVSYIWAEPQEEGSYDLLCEELCGVGHYAMRGRVIVDSEEDYAAWLAVQPTFAETQADWARISSPDRPLTQFAVPVTVPMPRATRPCMRRGWREWMPNT